MTVAHDAPCAITGGSELIAVTAGDAHRMHCAMPWRQAVPFLACEQRRRERKRAALAIVSSGKGGHVGTRTSSDSVFGLRTENAFVPRLHG